MTNQQIATSVGSPDPELNSIRFLDGKYVCSGSDELFCCKEGLWIREGTCDPGNL